MRFKKILAAFTAAVIMVVGLTGCNGKDAVGTNADAQDENKNTVAGLDEIGYILPYLRSDSLNPYEAEQLINQNLDLLLYDSLFTVDNSFKAIPQIAESYSADEKTITVILKSGVTFTDGSALTASDVVYSFKKAKKSDT
ncbi:MAG: ABC transporter substrate-binding protein, partial [Clostridia bacterium]|nr:ABC transporter substrate-binding protein [Clostridia bacterium]